MPKIEPDSFENGIKRYGKIIQHGIGLKEMYKAAKVSREIQFGFNHVRDNQVKTKQLKLF